MILRDEKSQPVGKPVSPMQKETIQNKYNTDMPIFKDTIEICVSDFEDLVRADTKMQILTELFEKHATVTQDVLYIILGVNGGRK